MLSWWFVGYKVSQVVILFLRLERTHSVHNKKQTRVFVSYYYYFKKYFHKLFFFNITIYEHICVACFFLFPEAGISVTNLRVV